MTKTQKAKYHKVNKDEHEILMDEFYGRNQSIIDPNEKAFDFTPINDYNSIFKYSSNRNTHRQNTDLLKCEPKPLTGSEKILNLAIIGFFYFLMIIFMPLSLIICLKKVKEHERIVNYRLGRIVSPEYRPGYCILFPFIDNYQRLNVVLKEFSIPNLQILTCENAIVDVSIQIRYRINDVIKMTNTIQDFNSSLKSIARGVLVNLVSKKDASKIEVEINYIKQEFMAAMNQTITKWGLEIVEVELMINSIVKDENADNFEDPALKTIKTVFKSLFNSSSSDDSNQSKPTASSGANDGGGGQLPQELMSFFQTLAPMVIPNDPEGGGLTAALSGQPTTSATAQKQQLTNASPYKILKLLEPLINESLVKEIQTVYEFHIKSKSTSQYEHDKCEIFHLDLKYAPKGKLGMGPYVFSKVDCVIKLSDDDLNELLTDNLKPFTAYMSGRIEIEGDLQDVFKLKKLIKSVTSVLLPKIKK